MKYPLGLLLLLAALWAQLVAASRMDIIADRRRQNFFDPIYAFDDVDAHTVSVAKSEAPISRPAEIVRPKVNVSSFVAAKKNSSTLAEPMKANQQKRASLFEELATSAKVASDRASLELASTNSTPKKAALSSPANQYVLTDLSIARSSQLKQAPERHHWSGLENYYKMLQQQQQQQQRPQSVDDTIYQISQEPAQRAELIGWTGDQSWILNYNQQQQQQQQTSIKSGPILLPSYDAAKLPASRAQSSFLFPYDQSYVPTYKPIGAVKGQQTGATGAPVLQLLDQTHVAQSPVYDNESSQELSLLSRDDLIRRLLKEQTKSKPQAEPPRYPIDERLPSFLWTAQDRAERRPLILNDGRVVHQEPAKLQEFMDIQRQQQRYRHQQETLGSIYDSQRMREQYQEEIYCRARNLVSIRLAPAAGIGASNQTATNPSQLAQLRIDPSNGSQDVTVQLSAGEFPSHMGLYNGTPSDDNFLCAATWIHDAYALTLATCVESADAKTLTVRFGEWNLNRPLKDDKQAARMFTGTIREIIVFPKYNKNNSLEHNLALLRLERPVNFLQVPYASPACQRESRNPLQRARSCWAPIRNITLSEYFDAEGEGETKEKKNVSMIEMPIKLIADDEAECFRQSGVEFFNLHHPNYICSADYRRAPWRAKLNQSDHFGSGVYCNEAGNLSLVSLVQPIGKNSTTAIGFLDLSYYRPWMSSVIYAQN